MNLNSKYPLFSLLRHGLLLVCITGAHIRSGQADVIEALKSLSQPLDEGLKTLRERMAESTLVLLGEASHGTSEYYTQRGRISLDLIQQHGFRFVAVEGDWNSIYRLHLYVTGQTDPEGGAREIMRGFTRWPQWMWANEEFAHFVEELREWNLTREPEERAGLLGIDVYGFEDALRELPERLAGSHPDQAERVREHLRCFDRYRNDMGAYARASASRLVSPCANAATSVVRLIESLSEDDNPEHLLHLQQMAQVIQNAERHYSSMGRGGAVSWNHRASHFYETVERLLAFYGSEAQGIVWAHNTHIGDARATDMARAGHHNIGQLARQALGAERITAVGFGTRQGTLLAGRNWGGTRTVMTKPPAGPGSAEDLKFSAGEGDRVFFYEDAPEALFRPLGHRAAGVIYHPEREFPGNYVSTVLPERYDAFIFLETTQALTPVE